MCGIFGFLGKMNTLEILNKLECLEYRGYDSCGIAYVENDELFIDKEVGNVSNLKKNIENKECMLAICHTRWATHGSVSLLNAHPHTSMNKRFVICHNGMIDNYKEIKNEYNINTISDTDSEVIVHLLDYLSKSYDTLSSISIIRKIIKGSYAIVIIDRNELNRLYFLKNKSPMLIAKDSNNIMISSDQIAFDYNMEVIVLCDNDYGYIENKELYVFPNDINRNSFVKNNTTKQIERDKHYLYEEILYQKDMVIKIGDYYKEIDLFIFNRFLNECDEIVFVGAGSSFYACAILANYYEVKLKKRCLFVVASELANFNILKNSLFILLSQSVETADLCNALDIIKNSNSRVVTLCNNVYSTLAFNSDYVFPLLAQEEISVASTKAFTAMIYVGRILIDNTFCNNKLILSKGIAEVIKIKDRIYELAKKIVSKKCIFYIGKGMDYHICQEAALKIREVSYLHSYAFLAGELKHGSIALVDEDAIAIAISTDKKDFVSINNSIEEIKSRKAEVFLLSTIDSNADFYFPYDMISAIIFVQLLAYYSALLLNRSIDQPRNLAKSVTVL